MEYRRMDSLKVAIVQDRIYMYMPNSELKVAKIADNKQHLEMIQSSFISITQEEFEKDIPCKDIYDSIACTMYFSSVEAIITPKTC